MPELKPNWQPMLSWNKRAVLGSLLTERQREEVRQQHPSWSDSDINLSHWEMVMMESEPHTPNAAPSSECNSPRTVTKEEWDSYSPAKQWEYVRVCEELFLDRDRLLKAIPECPVHGACVPHALDWIKQKLAAEPDAPTCEQLATVESRLSETLERIRTGKDFVVEVEGDTVRIGPAKRCSHHKDAATATWTPSERDRLAELIWAAIETNRKAGLSDFSDETSMLFKLRRKLFAEPEQPKRTKSAPKSAGEIFPSPQEFKVASCTGHKTLRVGDLVAVAEDANMHNVLIRTSDMTIHAIQVDDYGYVILEPMQ